LRRKTYFKKEIAYQTHRGGTFLFDKNLTVPIPLLQAEAVERRISTSHEKIQEVKTKIKILRFGYNGEKELNFQDKNGFALPANLFQKMPI
jgi:hypothetical protein